MASCFQHINECLYVVKSQLRSHWAVYVCSGTESEKLEWFRTINIAGETLTDQELRNAVYAGEWLTDAKRWFEGDEDGRKEGAFFNIVATF